MNKYIFVIVVFSSLLIGCASTENTFKIQPGVSFSWYPWTETVLQYVGDAPTTDARDALESAANYQTDVHSNILSTFEMNLKFFKNYGASLGLHIDDPTFQKISKIMGAVNSERFGVKFEYHSLKGKTRFTGDNLGIDYNNEVPPDFDFDMKNTMVKLFYYWDLEDFAGISDAPMQVGIFWKRVDGPAIPLSLSKDGELKIANINDKLLQNFYGVYFFWDYGEVGREDPLNNGAFFFLNVEGALGFGSSPFKTYSGGASSIAEGIGVYALGRASTGIAGDIMLLRNSYITWFAGLEGYIELMMHMNYAIGPFVKLKMSF